MYSFQREAGILWFFLLRTVLFSINITWLSSFLFIFGCEKNISRRIKGIWNMSDVTDDIFGGRQFTKLFPALRPVVNEPLPVSEGPRVSEGEGLDCTVLLLFFPDLGSCQLFPSSFRASLAKNGEWFWGEIFPVTAARVFKIVQKLKGQKRIWYISPWFH